MNKKLIINKVLFVFFLPLLIFSFTNQINAESQGGVIHGKILDEDSGLGVTDTIIRIEKNDEEIFTIFSDEEGNYKVTDLEGGDYTLSIYPPPGYNPVDDKIVSIKQAEEKEVNFIVTPHYNYIILGKVYKSDGKTPLEGAKVRAYSTEDGMPDGLASASKNDGSYTVESLSPAAYNLLCSSDKAAFPARENIMLTEEKTSGIDFIAYDNSISGVVKDGKGNPARDAKVSVQYMPTIDDIQDSNIFVIKMMGQLRQPVKTDNNGKYEITSLMPGNYNIEIYSATYGRKVKKNVIIKSDTKISKLNFTLWEPETISSIYGKVTEEDSVTPIANALITLIDSNNVLVGEILESSSKGTFEIKGLNEGTHYLCVKKEGLATAIKEIKIQKGKKINVRLIMGMPGSISGTVYRNDQKTPAKNIGVFAVKKDSTGIATTDENGFFKIIDLKQGIYELQAMSLDGEKATIENVEVKTNKETSNVSIYLTD